MSHTLREPGINHVLASLPLEDQAFLADAIRVERPARGEVLASHIKSSRDIWFPHSGVVALSAADEDGRGAQTGVVGAEGFIGVEVLMDDTLPVADATVQIEGDISVVSTRRLRSAMRSRPAIRTAMVKYLYSLAAQSLRITACNRLHSLEQRCGTWLLIMQDRIGSDDIPLTQDSLVALLGGGRPRINKILGGLERSGLVRRQRGHIRLLNRDGLEQRACMCHRKILQILDKRGVVAK